MENKSSQVDHIYKNLVEDFNPAIKNFVAASKAHVKSLHEASNTTKAYLDSLSTLCGSFEKGFPHLFSKEGKFPSLVEDCKSLALQQMDDLKTKYLDFLLPLEINMDKDWKILQAEHKKYVSLQKARQDTTAKVCNILKKHHKGRSGSRATFGKNMKKFQVLEEERELLEAFLEKSIETVSHHEQQRYMFIYHYLQTMIKFYISCERKNIEKLRHYADEDDDTADKLSCIDIESDSAFLSPKESIYSTLPAGRSNTKKRSDFSSRRSQSLDNVIGADEKNNFVARSSSFVSPKDNNLSEDSTMATAIKSYSERGTKMLNFKIKDEILLIGEPERRWQFGVNQRTKDRGWFPLCYVKTISTSPKKPTSAKNRMSKYHHNTCQIERCHTLNEQDFNCHEVNSASSETLHASKQCSSMSESISSCCQSRRSLSLDSRRRLDSVRCSCERSSSSHHHEGEPFCCYASISPSLCRSLTSNDLPPCFKRSPSSSKHSCECSDDSGFNNDLSEENLVKRNRKSETLNSKWINTFYEDFDRSLARKRQAAAEEGSPTFLNYLYPEQADGASIDTLERSKCSSRESWFSSAIRSLGKKNRQNIVSACSRKIASQKARRKKNEKEPQYKLSERSSSLLCLDITSCSRSPEDIYATNYEDIIYYAQSDLKNLHPATPPTPPSHDPPNNINSPKTLPRSESKDASLDPYFIVKDHKYHKRHNKWANQSPSQSGTPSKKDCAPPLPPRKHYKSTTSINIFNYKEYLSQRLFNSSYRLDESSYTTGNQCSPWYDLWDHAAKGTT